MAASDIPQRANGGTVDAGWWNSIRTFLITLESMVNAFLGAGASSTEATFAIADNTAAANITGLIISPLYRVTRIRYWVRRVASGPTLVTIESGELVVTYDGTLFAIGRPWFIGSAGMTFDIDTATGQVKYTSDDMVGTYDTVNSKIGYTRTTQGTI